MWHLLPGFAVAALTLSFSGRVGILPAIEASRRNLINEWALGNRRQDASARGERSTYLRAAAKDPKTHAKRPGFLNPWPLTNLITEA
jgi:hypothetical protein